MLPSGTDGVNKKKPRADIDRGFSFLLTYVVPSLTDELDSQSRIN